MARKRYDIGWLFCLILLLQSCGNDASFDAVVEPATQTSTGCTFTAITVTGPIGGATPVYCQTVGPVQFHVQRSADDTTPVGDANVRIDIGNSVGDGVLLLNSTGTACFNGGDPTASPPPSGCLSLDTKTDKFGVVSFQVRTTPIEGCDGATTDITSSTFARVTISNSSGNWQMDNTIKCK
ncbi:MAG: hypothetical protein HY203_03165 [Nitrospirae bacterium]|nr:hypothetical protein [Nitrospirota bacterium]